MTDSLKERAINAFLFAITAAVFLPVGLIVFLSMYVLFIGFCLVGPILILTGEFELQRDGLSTVRLKRKEKAIQ